MKTLIAFTQGNEKSVIGQIAIKLSAGKAFAEDELFFSYSESLVFGRHKSNSTNIYKDDNLDVRFKDYVKKFIFKKSIILFFLRKILDKILKKAFSNLQYAKLISTICKEENIDHFIFVTNNHRFFKSLNRLKVNFTVFLTDPINVSHHKIENLIIKKCSAYFVPHSFLPEYINRFPNEKDKIVGSFLPLFNPCQYKRVEKQTNQIHIGYFGGFLHNRVQIPFLNFIDKQDVILDIYSNTRPLSSVYKHVFYHEFCVGNQIYLEMLKMDFLLIFDNSLSNEKKLLKYLPSKAITYISSGKPIIVLGTNVNTETNKFLKNYPEAYFLDVNSIDFYSNFLALISSKHTRVSMDFVSLKYYMCTADYISELIKSKMQLKS